MKTGYLPECKDGSLALASSRTPEKLLYAIVTQPDAHNDPICFQQTRTPAPGAGQVLVRVRFAALNRNDALTVKARAELGGPCIIGSDGAGNVASIGAGVHGLTVGQEVILLPCLHWGGREEAPDPEFEILGYPTPGTHAEFILLPAENVFPKPVNLDWEHAAALPLAGLTAWRALVTQAKVRAGQRVLITGASGGVAGYLIQIAVALGAEVWVTSSKKEAITTATDLGALGGVIRSNDWHTELFQLANGPFDTIVDSAGADWSILIASLRPGGRLVVLGRTAEKQATIDIHSVFWSHVSIHGTSMGSPREFAALLQHISHNSWRPIIDSIYPMSDPLTAYTRLDDPARFGKVVLAAP